MIYFDLIYIVNDVVYYCVVNMFGVVLCIFIYVLNNVILLFVLVLVDKGVE